MTWVPSDPTAWDLDHFHKFPAARRALLALATNTFLDGLLKHTQPDTKMTGAPVTVVMDDPDEDDTTITQLVTWLTEHGYTAPELAVEVSDPETGEMMCTAEAYWPTGLQPGIGAPVVLELDEAQHVEEQLTSLGHLVFTSVEGLHAYVEHEESLANS